MLESFIIISIFGIRNKFHGYRFHLCIKFTKGQEAWAMELHKLLQLVKGDVKSYEWKKDVQLHQVIEVDGMIKKVPKDLPFSSKRHNIIRISVTTY